MVVMVVVEVAAAAAMVVQSMLYTSGPSTSQPSSFAHTNSPQDTLA